METKKIDIYLRNRNGNLVYETSTMASPTCKQAKSNFCIRHGLDQTQVVCHFSKP